MVVTQQGQSQEAKTKQDAGREDRGRATLLQGHRRDRNAGSGKGAEEAGASREKLPPGRACLRVKRRSERKKG